MSLVLVLMLTTGCTDDILAPPDEREAELVETPLLEAATSPVTTFTCTRSWASASDGDWSDAGMWSPAGVPNAADLVCIDVSGSYEVTLDQDASVSRLRVGGASGDAALNVQHNLHIGFGLVVEPGGELKIDPTNQTLELGAPWDPSAVSGPAWFVNRGYVEVQDGCTCSPVARWSFQEYINEAWLILAGPMDIGVIGQGPPQTGAGRDFTNRAYLLTHGADTVRVFGTGPFPTYQAGYFTVEEGMVGGRVPVLVTNFWEAVWSGGSISTYHGAPLLVVTRDLTLQGDDMSGMIEVLDPAVIEGEVGPDAHVRVRTRGSGWTNLRGPSWPAPPGSGFVNAGVLEVLLEPGFDFEFILLDEFSNRGELRVSGEGELHLEPFPSTRVQNSGSVIIETGASVRFGPSELALFPGSQMSGAVVLDDVTVTGSGALGDVVSEGARLRPGLVPTVKPLPRLAYGTITASSLVLDGASRVMMQVGGAGQGRQDRVVVSGPATYDGTLELETVAPLQGGLCGQVFPLVTHGAGLSLGTFANLEGARLAPSRAWRLNHGSEQVALAGYRPGPEALHFAPPLLAMEEGGTPATPTLCLGETPPTSDVTLSFAGTTSQVIPPAATTFAASEWALPATLTVEVVDDAVAEGVHADTIRLSAATGDAYYGSAALPSLAVTITDNEIAADLEIVKVSQEDNKFLGDTMNTVFRVTNLGPDESTGATVVSTPVGGLDFLSGDGASCSVDGAGVVTCVIGGIPSGGQVDITISFEGALVGVHASTWTASGSEPDPNTGNDFVEYSQRVN